MRIIDGVVYEFNEARRCWLVKCVEDGFSTQKVYIPKEIEGYPVKEIGSYAFSRCDALTEIILPESIYQICFGAFSRCANLNSVIIKVYDSTVYIHSEAFANCKQLMTVQASKCKLAILEKAFVQCENLEYVLSEINLLGDYVFLDCNNIKNLIFANDADISEKSLVSAVVNSISFVGTANIKNPSRFRYNLHPNTWIQCTPSFQYIDWGYEGRKIFVKN